MIVQSQSGTGKTAVFGISSLQLVDLNVREPQVLILSNTRELAEQSQKVISSLGDVMNIQVHCCVGGKSIQDDIAKLEHGVHIVSGTPGRVYDMINRKALKTRNIKLLVLDEADEMLNRGFKKAVYEIYRFLPPLQIAVISATLPREVISMTDLFMRNPLKILVERDELTLDGISFFFFNLIAIRQFFILVNEDQYKLDTLVDLYDTLTITQAVIFCNEKKRVDYVAEEMRKRSFSVCSIHSDLEQKDRDKIMEEFRDGQFRILIGNYLFFIFLIKSN